MIDYLHKFPDETTAQSVLADYYDAETGWQLAGTGFALDAGGRAGGHRHDRPRESGQHTD
jgi:hypothetical protein